LRIAPATADMKADCRQWLKEQFDAHDTAQMTKPQLQLMAQAAIAGLSGRAFDAVWSELIDLYPSRSMPGVKPKA